LLFKAVVFLFTWSVAITIIVPMAAIEVMSLTKRYGRVCGVRDVSFSIEPGEIFGYLGPNGSGKTTTIRCIMGLLRPSGGGVRLLGERVATGRATQHAKVGYLPGEFRIWARPRARRSLSVLAALGDGDVTKTRREELAKRLDLKLDRPVGDLSKGNRQKVAVICAIQHRPAALILDEPTAGLDPLMRQVVLDLVREAAEGGAAVLLSSHDLSEVSAICGRAGILREGKLVEVAPISQIVQKGEHRLKVWFLDATLITDLPDKQMPGVRIVDRQPGMLHIAYQGGCDGIIKWLSQFGIDRIATPQTSLEEAFMQYYREPQSSEEDIAGTANG
jgi:ABC-2 type transport system ATP-binding protein